MSQQLPPIPLGAINGDLDWAILIRKGPNYPFDNDGKKISEIPVKYSYTICLPGNCYTTLTVGIPGSTDALSAVSDEQIAEACAALRPVLVRFTNATVRIYTFKGEQRMSATADAVELVKANK